MRQRAYNLMEIVVALGLSGVLFSCAISAFRLLAQTQHETANRQTAIQILDNTVERVAVLATRDRASLDRILQDEFGKSGLAGMNRRFGVLCESGNGDWRLAVLRASGRPLADVRVPE